MMDEELAAARRKAEAAGAPPELLDYVDAMVRSTLSGGPTKERVYDSDMTEVIAAVENLKQRAVMRLENPPTTSYQQERRDQYGRPVAKTLGPSDLLQHMHLVTWAQSFHWPDGGEHGPSDGGHVNWPTVHGQDVRWPPSMWDRNEEAAWRLCVVRTVNRLVNALGCCLEQLRESGIEVAPGNPELVPDPPGNGSWNGSPASWK